MRGHYLSFIYLEMIYRSASKNVFMFYCENDLYLSDVINSLGYMEVPVAMDQN